MAMGETIYRLVPEEHRVIEKPTMYRSRHSPNSILAGSTFGTQGTTQPKGAAVVKRQSHGTFGRKAEDYQPSPETYLKKGEGYISVRADLMQKQIQMEATAEVSAAKASERMARSEAGAKLVPRRNDKPVIGLRSNKNFVTANAVEAILAVPTCKKPVEPNYLLKEEYGRVPAYLAQVKDEIERENDMIDSYVRDQLDMSTGEDKNQYEEFEECERSELLDALKAKWDETNKTYQLLAHIVDLQSGKKRRKERLEGEMVALEADILKLEARGPVLLVRES